MKATVTLKEGLRYYRTDGSFVDLKQGDVVEADDIPELHRDERFRSGHLKPVGYLGPPVKGPGPSPGPAPPPPAKAPAAAPTVKK